MGPLRDPSPRGQLWLWHHASLNVTNSDEPIALALNGYPDEADFHPLGTALHAESGTLFVVNHARYSSSVEVFRLSQESPWKLQYVQTLRHPEATHTPNALVALSETSLLISNDHFVARRAPPLQEVAQAYAARTGNALLGRTLAQIVIVPFLAAILPKAETMLGIRGGWISQVQLSGQLGSQNLSTKVVACGIPFANGIAISPNRKFLAVAATTEPAVRLYHLESEESTSDGWLPRLRNEEGKAFQRISLRFTPDNVAFTQPHMAAEVPDDQSPFGGAARLIVAGHPNPLELLKRSKDPYSGTVKPSSSWAVAIDASRHSARTASSMPANLAKPVPERFAQAQERKPAGEWRWTVTSLYQSNGLATENSSGRRIGTSSSSAAVYDEQRQTLIVAGLYHPGVLACSGVSITL